MEALKVCLLSSGELGNVNSYWFYFLKRKSLALLRFRRVPLKRPRPLGASDRSPSKTLTVFSILTNRERRARPPAGCRRVSGLPEQPGGWAGLLSRLPLRSPSNHSSGPAACLQEAAVLIYPILKLSTSSFSPCQH